MRRIDVKRAVDAMLAALLMVLCALVVACAALAVLLVDGRPVFYSQWRDGRDGKPFRMWKVRTMRRDAERRLAALLASDAALADEYDRLLCLRDDPRVLPGVGRLLRGSSIDELPQLVNVLRGHMSLVGPRPLPVDLIPRLSAEHLDRRREVRPGLTGLWQVSGRSTNDVDAWASLDVSYVERRSFGRDLAILARTPRALVQRRGAY